MSFTVSYWGRLGNQIIRNIAVSLLAQQTNMHVTYSSHELISKLGIDLFSGTKQYANIIRLTDQNYMSFYEQCYLYLNRNFGEIDAFFQTKDIISLIYNYLHSDKIKASIINKNPFAKRYQHNNDVCIHIRLDDVSHHSPGLDYYQNTLSKITFDTLYLTTDQKNHIIIHKLISLYPTATIIDYDEIKTFQFASTCKHIILSHGSFSAIIGYLAYFSDVYYQEYDLSTMWHGDMFSIPGWNKISKI